MKYSLLGWVHRWASALVAGICVIMFVLMFFSGKNDSAVIDEVPHIASAYSYVRYQDARLNPEHPPLLKDIAGIPLLFLRPTFPLDSTAWSRDANGQWDAGFAFLYHSGNNPDQILFWSRLPMMLLGVLLVIGVYRFGVMIGGKVTGVFAAFVVAFSPTILAHARYVTTDVGMALFTLLALYFYTRFLKGPSWKRMFIAGCVLGLALLSKFSSVLLLPVIGGFVIVYSLFRKSGNTFHLFGSAKIRHHRWQNIVVDWSSYILIVIIAFIVVGLVYIFHVVRMPLDVQQRLIQGSLGATNPIRPLLLKLAGSDILIVRAYAEYVLGVAMVYMRSIGGNTTYFLGEVSNQGWWYYFPVSFLLKIPLATHLLWIIALVSALRLMIIHHVFSSVTRLGSRIREYIQEHQGESMMLFFIVLYCVSSLTSILNIGIRHLLPIVPLIILLSSKRVISLLYVARMQRLKFAAIGILLLWLVVVQFIIYPSYLTYYNELVGLPKNGYHYITDSNFAWGQDFRRLVTYMDENNIQKIKLDYFGGALPEYYLPNRFEHISPSDDVPSGGVWVAIDAQQYSLSFADTPTYERYLEKGELRAQIGNSIFVLYFP